MYIPQPEQYYMDIADLACLVLDIPLAERDTLLGKKTVREKEKKKLKYKKKGRVRYESIYINKHQQSIAMAKIFYHYYLWVKKIKSPVRVNSELSYIFSAEQTINACSDTKAAYDLFYDLSERIEIKPFIRKNIIVFEFQ